MTGPTIIVLTEEALDAGDAQRIAALHPDEPIHYRVLVPADVERSLLADVLDHLSLLELRQALDAARGEDDHPTRSEASAALSQSVQALRAQFDGTEGASADGLIIDGDPVDELRECVQNDSGTSEVVIVTRPHAVEDTFHRDWASRARHILGLPVLHVYAGSSFLG